MKRIARFLRAVARVALKLILVMAALVVMAAVVVVVLLRSDWLYERVERDLPTRLKPSGIVLTVSGLRGPLPGHLAFDELTLADEEGLWLEAQDFRFHLKLWPLLMGRVDVEAIRCSHLAIERLPEAGRREEEQDEKEPGERSRGWPAILKGAEIRRLEIERLLLGSQLTGTNTEFSVFSSIWLVPDEGLRAEFDLIRLDGPLNEVKVSMNFRNGFDEGTVDVTVQEGRAGLLEHFLGAAYSPFAFSLKAGGPLRNWKGMIQAEMGEQDQMFVLDAPFRYQGWQVFELDWTFRQTVMPGVATGRLRVTGPLDDPSLEWQAEANGYDFSEFAHYPLSPLGLKMELALRDAACRATFRAEGLDGVCFDAQAVLPVRFSLRPFSFELLRDEPGSGDVALSVDLAAVAPLAQTFQQHCSGRLEGRGAWSGTLDHPELEGSVRLRDGTYENWVWGTALRDIRMHLLMERNSLQIEQFTARDWSGGRLDIGGGLLFGLTDEQPLWVHVRMKEFNLANDVRLMLTLDADIVAHGSLDALVIEGTSTVQRAAVNLQHTLGPSIAEVEVIEINKPGRRPVPVQETAEDKGRAGRRSIALNLAVLAPGRIFVKGRGLNAEWKADIKVGGQAERPEVIGGLDLVRGTFVFLDRRMSLAQCGVYFDGGWPISPRIDVQATATVAGSLITLRIHGSLSDLQVDLRSDPARPQNEVLSLLLFGKLPSDLSVVEALRMAYGINLLTGGYDAMGALDTQTFLPVDQIAIQQGAGNEAVVTVGKYLTDEIYVEADKSLKGYGDSIKVEYNLTPFLQLRGQASTDDIVGQSLYLHWHRNY